MKRLATVIFLTALLLSGCKEQPSVKLVTQISVDWEPGAMTEDRVYRDDGKIQRVLNRMRQLGQRYRPDVDPEQLRSPSVLITVNFNDGSRHRYQLKGDRYIRSDSHHWQQADAEKIQRLQFLLKALPGDG